MLGDERRWVVKGFMPQTIGWVGLGLMGQPMALNLLRAGHVVRAYARRPEPLAAFVEAGGVRCDAPRSVAEGADIVFTIVSDTPDVEEVILGERGVLEGAHRGSIVVDMTTADANAIRVIAATLAEQGVEMLDAPVSGGVRGATDGTLSIMVGGALSVFERVRPLFDVLGANVVHIGDHGAGQITKACNQVVVSQAIAAIGEAFILAKANGVDPHRVREALLGGFAGSRILDSHGDRMLRGDYAPGFMTRLHKKDMRIVMNAAEAAGVALPSTALVTQLINAAVRHGMGDDDSISIFRLQKLLSSIGDD